MKDERMFELLRSQLALANEEKSGYLAQVSALTEEVHQLRLSQEQSSKEYLSEIKKLNARVGALTNAVLTKDKRIAKLESALVNALHDSHSSMLYQ